MLSTDQMRAIVYLKSPCVQHGLEAVRIPDGALEGRYCKSCVDELAQMLEDARDQGRRTLNLEAKR